MVRTLLRCVCVCVRLLLKICRERKENMSVRERTEGDHALIFWDGTSRNGWHRQPCVELCHMWPHHRGSRIRISTLHVVVLGGRVRAVPSGIEVRRSFCQIQAPTKSIYIHTCDAYAFELDSFCCENLSLRPILSLTCIPIPLLRREILCAESADLQVIL